MSTHCIAAVFWGVINLVFANNICSLSLRGETLKKYSLYTSCKYKGIQMPLQLYIHKHYTDIKNRMHQRDNVFMSTVDMQDPKLKCDFYL